MKLSPTYSGFGKLAARSSTLRFLALTAIALLFASLQVLAQEATIVGTVTDQSGAVVANAKVTATNAETGVARRLQRMRQASTRSEAFTSDITPYRLKRPGSSSQSKKASCSLWATVPAWTSRCKLARQRRPLPLKQRPSASRQKPPSRVI